MGIMAADGAVGKHVRQHRNRVRYNRWKQMEFHIALVEGSPATEVVQDALFDVDPSAVVDLDMSGLVMRISASTTAEDVLAVLQNTGWPASEKDLVQLPSICCGGCGG